MEGIPIRNARRGDIPSLLMLWSAFFEEVGRQDARLQPGPGLRDRLSQEITSRLRDPATRVLVAEEGRRLLVGFAAASRESEDLESGRPRAVLTECYVVPPRRRRGVGRRLACRLCDLLYEDGMRSVYLHAAVRMPGVVGFWQALGWTEVEAILESDTAGLPEVS